MPGSEVKAFLVSHPLVLYRILEAEARRLRTASAGAPDANGSPHGPGAALPGYLPIAEHGIIGDLHTVGARGHRRDDRLVLLPAFRLAERVRRDPRPPQRGGYYRDRARRPTSWTPKQLYFPDTNVLITRFLTQDGVGEVQDFMPIHDAPGSVYRHRLDPARDRRPRAS